MCIKCCVGCCLLILASVSFGVLVAQEPADPVDPVGMTGDAFVEALAENLELDWNPCPDTLDEQVRELADVRCAVIGDGNPRAEAERLGLLQARVGGQVLDIEYNEGQPNHLYAGMAGTVKLRQVIRSRLDESGRWVPMAPVALVPVFQRLDYLIGEQRISMWIQRDAEPLVEGGEPERWIAIRVNALDGPFPEFMPAR